MSVTTVDMFGTDPGRGTALDVLIPDRPCGDAAVRDAAVRDAATRARTTDDTVECALVSDYSRAERTFATRIFNTGGETPFASHSVAGVAALLVRRTHLEPGQVGRAAGADCQWLRTDGHTVEVPFTGPVVCHDVPGDPDLFGPYEGRPRASGVGRAFTVLRVGGDPRALPAPDTARMADRGLTDLTLFRWDPERREVLARVFAPGFGIPEDPGCLPAAAALGLTALGLTTVRQGSVTVRQVTSYGSESVLHCTGSVADGVAEVRVAGRVWIEGAG